MIDAGPERGDQLELRPSLGDEVGIDSIGNGGRQHIGALDRVHEGVATHRLIRKVELGVEQFSHPGLHLVGELAGDDDFGLTGDHDRV